MKHGTVVRPTMYLASLDIKTAFDGAKPKHVARFFLNGHNTHGWLIAALPRETSLSGKATFECVEMLTTRKRGSSTIVGEDGNTELGQCGGRMDEENKGYSLGHGR